MRTEPLVQSLRIALLYLSKRLTFPLPKVQLSKFVDNFDIDFALLRDKPCGFTCSLHWRRNNDIHFSMLEHSCNIGCLPTTVSTQLWITSTTPRETAFRSECGFSVSYQNQRRRLISGCHPSGKFVDGLRNINIDRSLPSLSLFCCIERFIGQSIGMRIRFTGNPIESDKRKIVNLPSLFGQSTHIGMLNLPTARHLLNDQFGIHSNFNASARIKLMSGIQSSD